MNDSFPSILTQLRREKGISQKAAAAQLGTSQALLSHYENGVRECGLDFVVRAARFYGVTCDYLLGNSTSRDGMPTYGEDELTANGKLGQISSSIILNSVNSLLTQTETWEEPWRSELKGYVILALYRILLSGTQVIPEDTPQQPWILMCDTMLKIKESRFFNSPEKENLKITESAPLETLIESAKLYLTETKELLNCNSDM